jgi:transposase
MPRCPVRDYQDRCEATRLDKNQLTRREIADMLSRSERWVYRTLARYDETVGLASLKDHSSRPHRSPNQTPADIEQAICQMKQAHPGWGRRQIRRQLCWQWRDDPTRRDKVSEARVRAVLKRHPEVAPSPPSLHRPAPRQIDYLACNLLWAADSHQTRLADGSSWETIHWLDLDSRYELGQVTAATLTEDLVVQSFLAVAARCGLPSLIKTDRDKLFYEPTSGLPTVFERVMTALAIVHLPIGPHQPWWNGVVERRIQTCQREVQLPSQGDAEAMNQAMEAERLFYDNERCHSKCDDQPPATKYVPSLRTLPPDFALEQVPLTLQPTVLTRQIQASGRMSVAGHSFYFARRYARQAVTVTVDGWGATAQAADGWQRTWDLHPTAQTHPAAPPLVATPLPLTRRVGRRGCLQLKHRLYYVGVAWVKQTVTLQPQGTSWVVTLPDGSTKTIPDPQLLPVPGPKRSLNRPHTPPAPQPEDAAVPIRRVTKTGQVRFHHRLYYVGIAHRGQNVLTMPTSQGLAIYSADKAWITTCPWKAETQPDKPPNPT